MKIFKTTLILFMFIGITYNALGQFTDDMESYVVGSPVNGDWWTEFTTGGGYGISSDVYALSGSKSMLVDGSFMDPVLDLGNKTSSVWLLNFYMYVPANKQSYMNIQGTVPISGGEWVVGNIFFNENLNSPGQGEIQDSALGAVSFNFPHDEWFQIWIEVDMSSGMSSATVTFKVDGEIVLPAGTPFTDSVGTIPTSFGGINFYSVAQTMETYYDDFYFGFPEDNTPPTAVCQNITVQLDNNGNTTITAQDIDGGSTDNFGIQNYTASQTVFTCDDLGPNNVTLTVEDYFGNTDTCVAVVTVLEALELEAPADLVIEGNIGQCFASNVDLGDPIEIGACTWNLTNDAPQEFPIGQTVVTWTLENGSGQTTTSQQLVEVYMSEVDNAQVCYVTSDWSNPSQNRVFSKYSASLNGQNVDYHEVFRESSTGEFETVGYIVPPAESFLDATVNNNIQSYRYKIRTMDICGEQGPLSDYHKTILLQSSIAADNSINLAWNPYLGVSFSTYYIYRSVNGGTFELLGSIAATNTSYNDISANVLENFYEYFVSIDATTCANDPFQNPSVRSNQEYVNPNLVIKDNNWLSSAITIYPNPASDYLNISVTDDLELREVVVYNTLGQQLMESTQDQINVSTLPFGVYYLSIETDQGSVNKSLLRE